MRSKERFPLYLSVALDEAKLRTILMREPCFRRRSRERGVLSKYSLRPGRYSIDMPLDFFDEALMSFCV